MVCANDPVNEDEGALSLLEVKLRNLGNVKRSPHHIHKKSTLTSDAAVKSKVWI